MKESTTFVGSDVHKETIAVAVAEEGGAAPRSLGTIPNRLEAVQAEWALVCTAHNLRKPAKAGLPA